MEYINFHHYNIADIEDFSTKAMEETIYHRKPLKKLDQDKEYTIPLRYKTINR